MHRVQWRFVGLKFDQMQDIEGSCQGFVYNLLALTCSSSKISLIFSGTFADGMRATIDFAESCRVTSSGLELQIEINGTKMDNFKFESAPSKADG